MQRKYLHPKAHVNAVISPLDADNTAAQDVEEPNIAF